ncbi:MAG: hypothetical protein AAFP84_13370 [Actinomycetota bacterium]
MPASPRGDHRRLDRPHAHPVEFVAVAVAGLGVLATARLRWVDSGPGSTFDGLELADALRRNALVPDWGTTLAGGLYLLVAAGGLLLATSGFSGVASAAGRLVGSAVLIASMLVGPATGGFPLDRWSSAPWVVLIAGVVSAAVSVVQLDRRRRMRRTAAGDVPGWR